MNYFDFVPIELIEIAVSYLNNDDFESFVKFKNVNFINWTNICRLHFNDLNLCKQIHDYEDYLKFLNIERLKERFELDENIINVYNLRTLYLNNNNIEILPREIFDLWNLEYLFLSGNKIKEIPEEIKKMYNLKVLKLDNNNIEILPKELFKLSRLGTLSLLGNNIREISDEISNLKNLHFLNLNSLINYDRDRIQSLLPNTIIKYRKLTKYNLKK